MFSLFELLYDGVYYVYKNREQLKWDAVILFVVHAWGRRSGMKMFRKFLVSHFKQLEDEETQWRKWVAKQIEQLGGEKFIPQRQYRGATRSKKFLVMNSATSSTLSQLAMLQDEQRRNPNMATLVIDAGHGGKDPGAISCTKKQEKDFNLTVALKVEERFKAIPDVKVVLTRNNDEFVELNDRAMIANAVKADAFISIHANSFLKSSKGTETYYTRPECKAFADMFHPFILAATGFRDNKVKKKSLAVTRKTTMPAILLEPGFLSNQEEEAILMSEDFMNRFAEAIVKGACAFLGVPYGVSTAQPVVKGVLTAISVVIGTQEPITGYLKDGISWIPARAVLPQITPYWEYKDKRILLKGQYVDTMLIDGASYIKSRDLLSVNAGVFYEPNYENAKTVLIYPPKQEGAV